MAIALDSANGLGSGTGDRSFDLTPTGTLRGVTVIICSVDASDSGTTVTADGTNIPEVTGQTNDSPQTQTTGDDHTIYIYHLGTSVPTGTLTIAVDRNGAGGSYNVIAFGTTADDDTEVEDAVASAAATADASVSLTTAADTFAAGGLSSDAAAISGIGPGTVLDTQASEVDFGAQVAGIYYASSLLSSGTPSADVTNSATNRLLYVVAIREVAGASTDGSGALDIGPIAASGDGDVDTHGDGDADLMPISSSGDGTVEVASTAGDADLMPISSSGDGGVEVSSTAGDADLMPINSSGTGTVSDAEINGTGDLDLLAIAASATGDVDVAGTGDLDLLPITASGDGDVDTDGTGDADLPAIAASGDGGVEVSSTAGDLDLMPIAASGDGEVLGGPIDGAGDLDLMPIAASGAGSVELVGIGDLDLMPIAASGAGSVEVVGIGDLDLMPIAASGIGSVVGGDIDASAELELVAVSLSGEGHVFNSGGGVEGFEVGYGPMGQGVNRRRLRFATGKGRAVS